MNEITLAELATAFGISNQALHKYAKDRGLLHSVRHGRAFFSPEMSRRLLVERGYCFKKKVVSVQAVMGASGRTTTVGALALRAGMYGARVLMLDMDPQSALSSMFEFDNDELPTWLDVVSGRAGAADATCSISANVDIIPSNPTNALLPAAIERSGGVAGLFDREIAKLREQYDFVVVDTAPTISSANRAISLVSDIVLVTAAPSSFGLRSLQLTLEEFKRIKMEASGRFEVRTVITQFEQGRLPCQKFLQECLALSGSSVMKTMIRFTKAARGINTSEFFDTRSTLKDDYDLLAREVLELPGGLEE
jgi:chromosome partitioning protein